MNKGDALNPDLTEELQYSSTYGTPHLLKWLKEHVKRVHAPKYDDWNVLCTAGNTDGTDAVMRACLDRGDHLLVEEFGEYFMIETRVPVLKIQLILVCSALQCPWASSQLVCPWTRKG